MAATSPSSTPGSTSLPCPPAATWLGKPSWAIRTLTRQEVLWLATAANKWFLREDDLGSIEAGNHADLTVLNRDCFTVNDEDFKRTRSLLTVVGGKVVHNEGVA